MSKTLAIGWIGQGDFGDEAMAFSLRKFLARKMNFRSLTYYSVGDFFECSTAGGLQLDYWHRNLPSWFQRFFSDRFRLQKVDSIIIGGGSLFHSENSIGWKYDLIKKAKKSNKIKAAVVGASFGPFASKKAETMCSRLLDNLDVVMTRDSESADIARSLSKKPEVITSYDVSLVGPYDEVSSVLGINKDPDKIGVILVAFTKDFVGKKKSEIVKCYSGIIEKVLSAGKKVVLYAMYIGKAYSDVDINNLLVEKFRDTGKVSAEVFTGNIFDMIKSFAGCSKIISMRYHGIVFSFLLGIPFLSLEYDIKNSRFCRDINYPLELYCELYNKFNCDLDERIEFLLNCCATPEGVENISSVKLNVNNGLDKLAMVMGES